MTTVSRRKFLKGILASFAAAASFKLFPTPQKVVLSVDKEGNATLIGAKLDVDSQSQATFK